MVNQISNEENKKWIGIQFGVWLWQGPISSIMSKKLKWQITIHLQKEWPLVCTLFLTIEFSLFPWPKSVQLIKKIHIKKRKDFTFANGYFSHFNFFHNRWIGPCKMVRKNEQKGSRKFFQHSFFLFSNNTYLLITQWFEMFC